MLLIVFIKGEVLGGEGLPIGLVIFVVVVVVVGGGKVGLGALPNVLSALLEVPSLSARSSSTSHFRILCATTALWS